MDSVQFLRNLSEFYVRISEPLMRVATYNDGLTYSLHTNKLQYAAKFSYGFKIGTICWITQKLALKNLEIIRECLNKENEQFLLSLNFKGNKLIIKFYNKFGKVVKKYKIKLVSINWF